jgi:hypothetical protein
MAQRDFYGTTLIAATQLPGSVHLLFPLDSRAEFGLSASGNYGHRTRPQSAVDRSACKKYKSIAAFHNAAS